MAWSVPCPECGTQNEPDGSGAVLCSHCGFFYRAPQPGPAAAGARGIETTLPGAATLPASAPPPATRAATYGGMGEIEAHLSELGIGFQRVSDTSIQVVRQIGPQTVHVTIDTARTIHIVSAEGVKDLTLGDSAGTRLHFDPGWKERYDFDLALEDKTFALMNAAGKELGNIPDDLPTPPLPASGGPGAPQGAITQKVLPPADVAEPPPPAPKLPPTPVPVLGFQRVPSSPLGMRRMPSSPQMAPPVLSPTPEPPAPGAPLGMQRTPSSPTLPSAKPAAIAATMMEAPSAPPLGMQRTPSSPTVPSAKPAAIAATMTEALRSVPDQEEPPQSLAEISAMIPKRVDVPSVITDLTEEPTQNEPLPRAAARAQDDAPLPVPAVILPSTPDGKPPVLSPATEGSPPPPAWRSTPAPPPVGAEPPRPSGRVHIANGTTRDVIGGPISGRAEEAPAGPVGGQQSLEELEPLEPLESSSDDPSVIVTEPSMAAYPPAGERRPSEVATEQRPRPPPPVLRRFDEPAPTDETTRSPIAPRAVAARARRSGVAWAALLGLAIGAAAGLQFAAPAQVAALFPPTAALEVRAGARSAREGDVDGALAHFRRATELDPRWAPAWRNLGVAYALKGDRVESAKAYRKYLELEQDPEQARQVRTLLEK